MASNTTLDPGAAGDTIVTKERTHDGDAAKQQGVFVSGVTGTEGAYTFVDVAAGGGVEAAALRVTLASDSTGVVSVDDNGASLTVDNAALSVTGGGVEATALRVTLASDSTGVLSVDDNGGSLTVDNGGTFAVQAASAGVAAHDAAVSGNPVLAGAYASAAAPTDVSADGDAVRLWALRNGSQVVNIAAAGALIGATSNALDVNIKSGAGSGGTASADDADFTQLTTNGTPAMGVYESTPTSVTDNDMGIVGITQTRAMKVAIDSGGITGRAEDAAHASGHEGVVVLAVRRDSAAVGSDTDGDYSTINVDASGRVWANVANTVTVASHAVTNAGTFATQAACAGVAADDAATSGNPVLIAGVAVETDGTDPTTVSAEGDAAYLRTDRARRLLVSEHHPRGFFVSADYGAAQTNASVKAAPGAGLSLYITDIVISNGATAGNVTLLDGSGGTVVFEIYPAINGGCTISLRNPIRLTANTALCITSTTVTTHSLNIGGYIAP